MVTSVLESRLPNLLVRMVELFVERDFLFFFFLCGVLFFFSLLLAFFIVARRGTHEKDALTSTGAPAASAPHNRDRGFPGRLGHVRSLITGALAHASIFAGGSHVAAVPDCLSLRPEVEVRHTNGEGPPVSVIAPVRTGTGFLRPVSVTADGCATSPGENRSGVVLSIARTSPASPDCRSGSSHLAPIAICQRPGRRPRIWSQ